MSVRSSRHTFAIAATLSAGALLAGAIVGFALSSPPAPAEAPAKIILTGATAAPTPHLVPPTLDTRALADRPLERVVLDDTVAPPPWPPAERAAPSAPAAAAPAVAPPTSAAGAATATASRKTAKSVAPARTAAKTTTKTKATAKVTPAKATAAAVSLVDAQLVSDVVKREPVGPVDRIVASDANPRVWAWLKLANDGPPTTVTTVWRKGDEVAFSLDLKVGTSAGWRTWSYKTVRRVDVGRWTVDVKDAAGHALGQLEFEVVGPEATADAG